MSRPMLLPPLELLPPAYVAENTSYPLFATCIAFLVIETIFMALLYTSRFLSSDKKANWHMVALMTGAYVVCLGKITIGLPVKIGGAGRHLETLPYPTIQTALKLNTALQLICPLTTSLTKMAILCLFHTIFGVASSRYRLVIRATFLLCLVTTLVQVIIPLANCKPFSATWTFGGQSACAIDGLYLWKYLSIPNVITTIIVVCIPIPAMYKLQISTATRLGLGVVLSVCICGVVAALMRFASFQALESFNDFSYAQVTPLCWTIAESGTYMVAGVLPTLRPLVRKVFGGVEFERILTGRFRSGGSAQESAVGGKGDEVSLVKKVGFRASVGTENTYVGVEDEEKGKIRGGGGR